ncbi:hypothetical protein ACFV4Q_26005 [Streptomyces nojiriensis]|uniref:hypothetical protein n=1 Tax=Streptomyces nojiriensis TaxID=66374 RepID=UPI00365B913E
MNAPSASDLLTYLVIAGCVAQLGVMAILRWGRLTCPECGLTIRFQGVKREEALRLRRHMRNHIARHTPAPADDGMGDSFDWVHGDRDNDTNGETR